MKVEKCPWCKQTPKFRDSQYSDVRKRTNVHCGCGAYGEWGGEWIVTLKFNRWARREAKRIAKESKIR